MTQGHFVIMTTEDDKYIWGAVNARQPLERIGAKLNITPEEVSQRYASVQAMQNAVDKTGVDDLVTVFETTCLQHDMVGEGLKLLGQNLCQPISPEEIRQKLTDGDPDQSVKNLMASFIILRPFKAPPMPTEAELSKLSS